MGVARTVERGQLPRCNRQPVRTSTRSHGESTPTALGASVEAEVSRDADNPGSGGGTVLLGVGSGEVLSDPVGSSFLESLHAPCTGGSRADHGVRIEDSYGAVRHHLPPPPYPGGHRIWRPPSRCTCRWGTDCPPSGPTLVTSR